MGVALLLAAGVSLAVRHTELVTGRYISSGVPPIPAFAALLFFSLLQPWVRRRAPRLALDRGQLLLIYCMLAIVVVLNGSYHVRAFLPHLAALDYRARTTPRMAPFAAEFPAVLAPRDAEVARGFFDGSLSGVPWGAWLGPLLAWLPLWVALFLGAGSLMLLMRRQWIAHERLAFPLLALPLGLTSGDEGGPAALFRRPLMWAGFGVAAAFNGLNILHALAPAVPAPGFYVGLGGNALERPWTPLNSIQFFFMLEAIGFGYFVPLELSFSTWFFYLLEKAFAVYGLSVGVDAPGFPFMQEQSAGAYLAVALLLLWGARRPLLAPLRRMLGGKTRLSPEEARDVTRGWIGVAASGALLLGWSLWVGLSLPLAATFFGVLCCFTLVYARLRAETGVPFEFIYPYGLPKELVIQAYSPRGILDGYGRSEWVLLSGLAWLSRHHTTEALAAYQADGLKLADEARIPQRALWTGLALAFVVGLVGAVWAHLDAYYTLGANMAAGGGGRGEYRAYVALQEYDQMLSRALSMPPRDTARLTATGCGAVMAAALWLLRVYRVGFPLHPLGYILATAYGDHTTIFFPMLAAWTLKTILLKAGGLRLYRRFVPFFLGLIIGHFFVAGVFWPLLSLLLGPETSRAYHLYFGG
jgi:hypothetical protein